MAFSKNNLKRKAKLHLQVRLRICKDKGLEHKHEDRVLKDKHATT